MKNDLKLSLLLKFKNTVPVYNIVPTPRFISESEYEFTLNPVEEFKFSVTVENIDLGSALIIDKILLNNNELHHLDSFGVYKTLSGKKKTYGYMDEPGSYTFKIRYNPLSHNYITYLLQKKSNV